MAPKSAGKIPACGFAVGGTKKGELNLKVEKRARGKKVTIIPNVSGDALKLVRALQSMLGVGGTIRQVDGVCTVEVQGEQTTRVEKALLDFKCLQGLSQTAMESLRSAHEGARADLAVDRTAATKFIANTQGKNALSPAEERRLAHERGVAFYSHFFDNIVPEDDFSDVWVETLNYSAPEIDVGDKQDKKVSGDLIDINCAFSALGMLPECGRAVKEFWEGTKMTISQFRKMALNPGARLIGEAGVKKMFVSNLISRQKISDFRSGGSRGGRYFSSGGSVIDDYQKGIVRTKEEREAAAAAAKAPKTEDTKLVVKTDASDGWCTGVLSYVVPLPVPASRLEDDEVDSVSKAALRSIEVQVNQDLTAVSNVVPGVECKLNTGAFSVDLELSEQQFLQAPKKDTGGKAPTAQDKEEMKLEKKLREICALKKRQREGEQLEKLQAEKVARQGELFKEVAEMKLRRAEKELLKVFKRLVPRFQDSFWEKEWQALYGDAPTDSSPSSAQPFGIFDGAGCDGSVTISPDGLLAESRGQQWASARLHLRVRRGEVAAFAIEILQGTIMRLGWELPNAPVGDLANTGRNSFGFGGTGKKVNGNLEPFGEAFGKGDIIHCEAEREDGQLRVGFAKNDVPLGVAFDVSDSGHSGDDGMVGVVCGKAFKARILSAECVPLDEAPEPALPNFLEFDPPRMAVVTRDYRPETDDCLRLHLGETVYVSSDDGEGWLFGYFLDPEDPDDGGWLPKDTVSFVDDDDPDWAAAPAPTLDDVVGDSQDWDVAPSVQDSAWSAPIAPEQDWGAPATAPTVPDWGAPAPTAPDWGEPSQGYPGGVVASVPAPAAASPPASQGHLPGLEEFLQSISLSKHLPKASAWCTEMGAASVDEIKEEWEDFADTLGLKPLERKRLQKAATGGK